VVLYYDSEPLKEVDFVKLKPFQFKPTINQNGSKITLEVRIKVLTSQLEDMLFRVGVVVNDSTNSKVLTSAMSEPVKVISKSDQVKKKKVSKKKRTAHDFFISCSDNH